MTQPARIKSVSSVPHSSAAHDPKMEHGKRPYRNLVVMGLLHLPLMYAIMFTMVYSLGDVFHNLNTFYMAGMMVAPMVLLMPLLMREMYPNKKLNWVAYGAAVVGFAVLYAFMRAQTFVGDRQFLRSMIPHHSGAVLMCERANIRDAEIAALCQRIIRDQKAEIEQMRRILERL